MTVYFPPEPKLEFAFEVKLQFHRLPGIETIPIGGGRGFVCLDGGTFQGPGIKGTAVPNTGGDYAHFRTDGVTSFEARYFLETDDGARILLNNHGYSYFHTPEAEKAWDAIKDGKGPPGEKAVPPEGYYFRTFPTFEAPPGKYDWLNRTVIVGSGARSLDGNLIRYYKVV